MPKQTNEQKYKTHEERVDAHSEYCIQDNPTCIGDGIRCVRCFEKWLALEAKEGAGNGE